MAKKKYHFDPQTLTYKEHNKNFSDKVVNFLGLLLTTSVSGFGFMLLFFVFFDSPKEQKLKRENAELLLQYEILDKELNKSDEILQDIQDRDDNIYRAIFETDPIASSIRDAGFGGTNRYKDLRSLEDADIVINTTKKLDILTKKLYVQSNSFDEIVDLAKNKEKMLMSTPSIMPVANKDLKRTASGWGMRVHPIHKVPKFHYGMDFSAAKGTEVHATGNGRVEKRVYSSSYGNYIIINHGFNYKTLYAHMSAFNVKVGQKVTRGQIIGFVGNTGRSSGAHLHYEVHYKGKKKDPKAYYFNDLTSEQYEEMIEISASYGQSFD